MARRIFFLLSDDGSSLSLARLLQAEGHRVQFHIFDPAAHDLGIGLVTRVASPTPPKDATVIFDSTGHGALGALFRARGLAVIGGNRFDRIETDRPFGARVMVESGIPVPETHPFSDIPTAQRWLRTHEGEWFMKVSGSGSTTLTYNAPDAETMSRYLEWSKRHLPALPTFELQRRVEGTVVSCEGWFDGQAFVPPFNCTVEEKRQLAGEHGVRTGCESCVVWAIEDPIAHLPRAVLVPLAEVLAQQGYVGTLDLNMVIDPTGRPHGLEWSARLGFDASQAYWTLLGDHVGEQLEAFAHGDLDRWSLPMDRVALTLRMSTPPYPVEDRTALARVKELPLDPDLLDGDGLHLKDVRLDDRRQPVLAGTDGWVVTVTAAGPSLMALRDRVLDRAGALVIPSSQYRIDPVDRAEDAWDALDRFGILGNRHLRADAELIGEPAGEPESPAPGPLEAGVAALPAPPLASTTIIVATAPAPDRDRGDPFMSSGRH